MTAESRTRYWSDAVEALSWFKIPRTVDHIAAIYAEDASKQTGVTFRSNATVDEILRAARYREDMRAGSGGYSDPTGDAAVSGWSDEDGATPKGKAAETLAKLAVVPESIHDHCHELADLVADLLVIARTNYGPHDSRQAHLGSAEATLHWLRPKLEDAIAYADSATEAHADWLLREQVCGQAAWLQVKCEHIWQAHRGQERQVAEQKQLNSCANCAKWRTGNTATTTTGLCAICDRFQDNHGVLPTEACFRWWDHSKGTPPRLVIEAKAAGRTKRRKAIG